MTGRYGRRGLKLSTRWQVSAASSQSSTDSTSASSTQPPASYSDSSPSTQTAATNPKPEHRHRVGSRCSDVLTHHTVGGVATSCSPVFAGVLNSAAKLLPHAKPVCCSTPFRAGAAAGPIPLASCSCALPRRRHRRLTRMSFRAPDFIIDADDPFKHDRLNRRARGESLCLRVLDDPGPLVVAVNGGFGSGKSVFLRIRRGMP